MTHQREVDPRGEPRVLPHVKVLQQAERDEHLREVMIGAHYLSFFKFRIMGGGTSTSPSINMMRTHYLSLLSRGWDEHLAEYLLHWPEVLLLHT